MKLVTFSKTCVHLAIWEEQGSVHLAVWRIILWADEAEVLQETY
jgi:hypothetical protein